MATRKTSGRRDDDEIVRLQRQYKQVDGDRKAKTDGTQAILKKQREQLKKLKEEQESLKAELKVVERQSAPASNDGEVAKLNSALKKQQAEVTSQTEYISDLDRHIKEAEKELSKKRRQASGRNSSNARQSKLSLQVKTLENRLDKVLKKFNECLTDNGKLRGVIDNLKQERKVFESMRRKLEKELQDLKIKIAEVIEASKQAYEARDEAQNRLSAVQEKAEKEEQLYAVEIKDLKRNLEHDGKLKSFMGAKAQPRSLEGLSDTMKAQDEVTPEQQLRSYEDAFNSIRKVTGIDDIDKIVARFVEVENQNFSLFNLVNELNNDIKATEDQIASIKSEIQSLNITSARDAESKSQDLQELEKQLEQLERKKEQYVSESERSQEELQALCDQIESLVAKSDVNQDELSALLGNSEIEESNVLQYLGAVERKVTELLQLQYLLDKQELEQWEAKAAKLQEEMEDDDEKVDPEEFLGPRPTPKSLLGMTLKRQAESMVVVPPSSDDVDDDDVEMQPLSHEDMKKKILTKTHA